VDRLRKAFVPVVNVRPSFHTNVSPSSASKRSEPVVSLVHVDRLEQERREHDVVVNDRIGVVAEVADAVEVRLPQTRMSV
jgi:hypothetical protein